MDNEKVNSTELNEEDLDNVNGGLLEPLAEKSGETTPMPTYIPEERGPDLSSMFSPDIDAFSGKPKLDTNFKFALDSNKK
jgi:hypothetical protein